MAVAVTMGQRFYNEQLAYLAENQTDELVEQHYAADGSIIAFDFVVKGQEALKAHFRRYMETLGYIKLISTDKFRETEDGANSAIFFEATVETRLGVVRVYDAFVLRDGKATHHFTGLK